VVAAQASSAAAETEATDALGTEAAAEAQARATLAQATAMLEEQEAKLPALLAQQAQTDATFYAALMELLGPEGAAAAFAQYELDVESQYSAEAAARAAAYYGGPVLSGSWALPLAGRFTSCFCQRWGSMHWGDRHRRADVHTHVFRWRRSRGEGGVRGRIRAGRLHQA
jgi:hypothetical protein